MRKVFAVLCALLLAITGGSAQVAWKVHSTGTSATLHRIACTLTSSGPPYYRISAVSVAVGDSGVILRQDGHESPWARASGVPAVAIRSVTLVYPDTGYVCGDSGLVLKVVHDSLTGTSCIPVSSPGGPPKRLNGIAIVPLGRLGYLAGDSGALYRTVNSGANWITQTIPTTANLNAVFLVDIKRTYVCGDSNKVLKTQKANQWTDVSPGPGYSGINYHDICFLQDTGWVVGDHGTILHTTNGALTWNSEASGVSVNLRSIFMISFGQSGYGTGFVVGDSGIVLTTSDGGSHWTRSETGTTLDLYGVGFSDALNGYIAGEGGLLLGTESGGLYKGMFSIQPTAVDFGSAAVGAQAHTPVVVKNIGVAPLTISSVSSSNIRFSVSPASAVIQPDSSQVFTVTFAPGRTATENTTVWFWHDGSNSQRSLSVTGEGVLPPAASGWSWQNPQPEGNVLTDVKFLSSSVAVAVGGLGSVMRTIDAGGHWSVQSYAGGALNCLTSVQFVDQHLGIAVGQYGTILRTTDGGMNWVSLQGPAGNYLMGASFRDLNHGTVVGYTGNWWGFIMHTTDGGSTWTTPLDGSDTTIGGLLAVSFADDQRGFAAGMGSFLRTTDGGTHWSEDSLAPGFYGTGIVFTSASIGFIAGGIWPSAGVIYRTADAGVHWAPVYSGSEFLSGISFSGTGHGIAAGLGGTVVRTTDGGATWSSPSVAVQGSYVQGVAVDDANNAIAVGGSSGFMKWYPAWYAAYFRWTGCVSRTTDGGVHWDNQAGGFLQHVRGVAQFGAQKVLAVGDTGMALRTTDGGAHWQSLFQGTLFERVGIPLTAVAFSDTDHGSISAGSGDILSTTDGGLTWHVYSSGLSLPLRGIAFADRLNGFVVGDLGTMLKTTDGGTHWLDFSGTVTDNLNAVSMSSPLDVLAVGNGGIILSSHDGGQSWQTCSAPVSVNFHGVSSHRGTAYTVGDSGVLLVSTDGGDTWTEQVSGILYALNAVKAADDSVGFAVGEKGTILWTTDGGRVWKSQSSGTTRGLFALSFFDINHGVAAGDVGTILVTSTGGLPLSVPGARPGVPKTFTLYQNFPNPFNPSTTLRFDVPRTSRVSVTVYDVLGQAVASLLDETRTAGRYELRWDAGGCASGVYFCRMRAGGFVETKKLLLMR